MCTAADAGVMTWEVCISASVSENDKPTIPSMYPTSSLMLLLPGFQPCGLRRSRNERENEILVQDPTASASVDPAWWFGVELCFGLSALFLLYSHSLRSIFVSSLSSVAYRSRSHVEHDILSPTCRPPCHELLLCRACSLSSLIPRHGPRGSISLSLTINERVRRDGDNLFFSTVSSPLSLAPYRQNIFILFLFID